MKRIALFSLAIMLAAAAWGQGPVFRQTDLWTLPYEDVSDLLRRYPGMYPMDYGTIGQPVLFRPWNLNPWEFRVVRDGIPQNRNFDGLYDPNLEPASELDTIRYDYLGNGGAGRFFVTTRHLPADTPYTEVHIREGFYGYGTVDFAQGERIHKSATLELTGRLVFYNGMRDSSAARFRRLRGRFGMDIGSRWRGEVTYAGSVVNTQTPLNSLGFYTERYDGMFAIAEKDSQRTTLSPSLKLYARQDREKWGNPFNAREFTKGSVLEAHAALADQQFTFRQSNALSTINFPGFRERYELWVELHASDSIALAPGSVTASGSLRRESNWGIGLASESKLLSDLGAEFESMPLYNFVLHGGTQYTEDLAPLAWRFGEYPLSQRPLLSAPEFRNTSLQFTPAPGTPIQGKDRYWKSDVGVRWNANGSYADVTAMALSQPGHFRNQFQTSTQFNSVYLDYVNVPKDTTQLGLCVNGSIPLKFGLRLEGSWFGQMSAKDLSHYVDSRGYLRLYFEHSFFTTPLIIRAHISDEFFGQRYAFSDLGAGYLGPNNVVGIRISATIRGVTAIWGTENFFNQRYYVLPGYKMIGKEEYLGFIVRLWL